MGEVTKISWTDHTFNPWSGCTRVSEGCKFCYAEREAARAPAIKGVWGPSGTRVARVESYWKQTFKWDVEAQAAGVRRRVFCASIADVFEQWEGRISSHKGGWISKSLKEWLTLDDIRLRLFKTIRQTPHLDWLLLTKRPEAIMATLRRCRDLLPTMDDCRVPNETHDMLSSWISGHPPANVWLGTSVEDQATADERIPHLLRVPAAVRWISAEPLLGPIDFREHIGHGKYRGNVAGQCVDIDGCTWHKDNDKCRDCGWGYPDDPDYPRRVPGIDWIIVGGESGAIVKVRRFDLAWARSIRDQCKASGLAFFLKQVGALCVDGECERCKGTGEMAHEIQAPDLPRLRCPACYGGKELGHYYDKAGANPDEWPRDVRIQEFPR